MKKGLVWDEVSGVTARHDELKTVKCEMRCQGWLYGTMYEKKCEMRCQGCDCMAQWMRRSVRWGVRGDCMARWKKFSVRWGVRGDCTARWIKKEECEMRWVSGDLMLYNYSLLLCTCPGKCPFTSSYVNRVIGTQHHVIRVVQDRIHTPHVTANFITPLTKTPYIHRV